VFLAKSAQWLENRGVDFFGSAKKCKRVKEEVRKWLETKGAIFAHFVRSAELIEKGCDRYSLEGRILKLGIASSVKRSGWLNWVEV